MRALPELVPHEMDGHRIKTADEATSAAAQKARKGINHMKYSTEGKKRTRYTVMVVAAVAAALILGMLTGNAARAAKPAWDVCYEMCNQHIEWTYAGR